MKGPATRPTAVLAVLLLASWPAARAAAEVEVSGLGRDVEPLATTDLVRHFRFEEGVEVEQLELGQGLAVGDLLTSLDDDLFLELACADGSLLRFTERFLVQINPVAEGVDCAVDFLDGKVDVLTDGETEVCSAGVCLGTGGTRFAVRLDRGSDRADRRVLVFEGGVTATEPGSQPAEVAAGQELIIRRRQAAAPEFERRRIDEEQIERWAGLYARFDVIKARAAGVELPPERLAAAREQFKTLHAAVLRQPDAAEARTRLAEVQLAYRVDREALYNVKRSGVASSETLRQIEVDEDRARRGDGADREKLLQLIRDSRLSPATGGESGLTAFDARRFTAQLQSALAVNPPDGISRREAASFWGDRIVALKEARERGEITARGYLVMARGYDALGDADSSRSMARRALAMAADGGGLSDDELAAARRLASGGY